MLPDNIFFTADTHFDHVNKQGRGHQAGVHRAVAEGVEEARWE
jgi:hypothetical protein